MQESLRDCLEDLCYGIAFFNEKVNSGYDITISFQDSITTDEETERKQDMQDISMGIMSPVEYRMKWYGEDEATAEKNLPSQADTIPDNIQVPVPNKKNIELKHNGSTVIQEKALNGAQTQSLIAIMAQYSSGNLTEGQAINLISTAIGITKEEAGKLLNGEVAE